jgi:hypothetical protein
VLYFQGDIDIGLLPFLYTAGEELPVLGISDPSSSIIEVISKLPKYEISSKESTIHSNQFRRAPEIQSGTN